MPLNPRPTFINSSAHEILQASKTNLLSIQNNKVWLLVNFIQKLAFTASFVRTKVKWQTGPRRSLFKWPVCVVFGTQWQKIYSFLNIDILFKKITAYTIYVSSSLYLLTLFILRNQHFNSFVNFNPFSICIWHSYKDTSIFITFFKFLWSDNL